MPHHRHTSHATSQAHHRHATSQAHRRHTTSQAHFPCHITGTLPMPHHRHTSHATSLQPCVHAVLQFCSRHTCMQRGASPSMLACRAAATEPCVHVMTQLHNHDLLTIGDGCHIDGGVRIQPSAYEYGHMILQVSAHFKWHSSTYPSFHTHPSLVPSQKFPSIHMPFPHHCFTQTSLIQRSLGSHMPFSDF